jgi:hypothetical protein
MDLQLAIIFWTACAVVAWWIAKTNGAPNPGTWAFAGLMFGPFGVLGAIAFAKPGPVPSAGALAGVSYTDTDKAGDRMLCGKCGKPLSPAWRGKCEHCKARYAEFTPVPRA